MQSSRIRVGVVGSRVYGLGFRVRVCVHHVCGVLLLRAIKKKKLSGDLSPSALDIVLLLSMLSSNPSSGDPRPRLRRVAEGCDADFHLAFTVLTWWTLRQHLTLHRFSVGCTLC